jgi:hypothetical protein
MVGSPGTGQSMLAQRLPAILSASTVGHFDCHQQVDISIVA